MLMTIKEIYKENCKDSEYGSILPIIKRLIKKKDIILEFGTGYWLVSSAILDWMWRYAKLISFDIRSNVDVKRLKEQAKIERKYFSYMFGSSKDVVVTDIDVLVIDTFHNANQLWAELYDNHKTCKRIIAIVGTNEYSRKGEREGHLWLDDAIDKFLEENTERKRKTVIEEGIWLTVLERA